MYKKYHRIWWDRYGIKGTMVISRVQIEYYIVGVWLAIVIISIFLLLGFWLIGMGDGCIRCQYLYGFSTDLLYYRKKYSLYFYQWRHIISQMIGQSVGMSFINGSLGVEIWSLADLIKAQSILDVHYCPFLYLKKVLSYIIYCMDCHSKALATIKIWINELMTKSSHLKSVLYQRSKQG